MYFDFKKVFDSLSYPIVAFEAKKSYEIEGYLLDRVTAFLKVFVTLVDLMSPVTSPRDQYWTYCILRLSLH